MYKRQLAAGAAAYALRCQTYEGGFGGEPGVEAHGGYVFCALAALVILNATDAVDLDALERWLARRQTRVEGGFQGRTNKLVDGCYSFWQGGTLALVAHVRRGHTRSDEAPPGLVWRPGGRAPPPAPPPPAPGRPLDEGRAATLALLASNSGAVAARRGAVALLGDSVAAAGVEDDAAGVGALLALVRPLYDEEVSVRVEAVRCAALLGSLDLAHFAMDDEAPPVRRRVLAALAEDGAFETGVLRDAATALRRRFSLAVSLMKALEDVSLEEGVLLGVAAKLRGTLLALPARRPALLAAPLEKGMQAQRSEAVREALVAIAGELRAVDSLRRIAIFDSSTAVRRRAVDALGANGALSELRELVFSGDDDAGIRGEALHWMARLDDLDGICRRGFNDRNAELRASAARLLLSLIHI